MEPTTLIYRRERFNLQAVVVTTQEGLIVTLTGGDRSHVGSVVLAEARPSQGEPWRYSTTASVLNRLGHQDEAVARPLAELLAQAWGKPVVVIAGVHWDLPGTIAPERLRQLQTEVQQLGQDILRGRDEAKLQ